MPAFVGKLPSFALIIRQPGSSTGSAAAALNVVSKASQQRNIGIIQVNGCDPQNFSPLPAIPLKQSANLLPAISLLYL